MLDPRPRPAPQPTAAQSRALAVATALLSLACVSFPAAAPDTRDTALATRLDVLESRVAGAEALRDARRLHHAYAQYLEQGLWGDIADLFTANAVATYGSDTAKGRAEIRAYLTRSFGDGAVGIQEGRLFFQAAMSPVLTMDPDGRTVRGRWRAMAIRATHGVSASWEGGIYENEYVQEGGVWKIAGLHYYPAWRGAYADAGWSETLEGAPYHYTPDRAGTPLPDTAQAALATRAPHGTLEARALTVARRAQALEDEDAIVRLQHVYGFYVDKKLWDDVVDLFTPAATMEVDQRGVYVGRDGIRRGLAAAGLATGELNDHLQLVPVVHVSPDGHRGWARGAELRMTGGNGAPAEWGYATYENDYEKKDGVWRIASLHVYGRLRADYETGFRTARPLDGPSAAARPDREPSVRYAAYPGVFHAPFHYPNPATGKPMASPARVALPAWATTSPQGHGDRVGLAARITESERLVERVLARVGAENVSDAYGYYIDDFSWDNTADLFADQGWKELSYIGTYVGRERVRASLKMRYANGRTRGGNFQAHQKTQPVITVAPDGQSARIRLRLIQLGGSIAGGGWIGGIYENGAVKERGVWRVSAMDLDYVWSATYKNGWGHVEASEPRRYAPTQPPAIPPDRGLRGVVFAPFPEHVDTGFHYPNPVSGRPPAVLVP